MEFVGVEVVVKVFVFVKKLAGVQVMVPVPVAIKSTDPPKQMVVSLLKVTFGALTFTVTCTVSEPQESEMTTLKVVVALIVAIGLAMLGLFRTFVGLQLYVVPPYASS